MSVPDPFLMETYRQAVDWLRGSLDRLIAALDAERPEGRPWSEAALRAQANQQNAMSAVQQLSAELKRQGVIL